MGCISCRGHNFEKSDRNKDMSPCRKGGEQHGLKTKDLKHLICDLSIHMTIIWHKLPMGIFFSKILLKM